MSNFWGSSLLLVESEKYLADGEPDMTPESDWKRIARAKVALLRGERELRCAEFLASHDIILTISTGY